MQKVLIVGDSHTEYFQPSERLNFHKYDYLKDIDYKFKLKRGATIKGFGRRKGSLKLADEVEEELSSSEYSHLVLALGQVDIELGLYYKQIIKNEDTTHFIDDVIKSYFETLSDLKNKYPLLLISIKGINPTVFLYRPFTVRYISRIINENVKVESSREVFRKKLDRELPAFYSRHRMHIDFNHKLKKMASDIGIHYFDLWEYLVDKNTGVISSSFVPFKFDHHIADTLETRIIHQRALFDLLTKR